MAEPSSVSTYLPAPAVARRYGVSKMTIWRWTRNPEMGFPPPVYFGRHKFFAVDELIAWEAQQPRGPRTEEDGSTPGVRHE